MVRKSLFHWFGWHTSHYGIRRYVFGDNCSCADYCSIANVNTPDARTITVQPWEKHMLNDIAKAIMEANLGLNPQNNGDLIIISVPMLTEERRKDLSKRAHAEGEHAKVGIRNARKEALDFIKTAQKDGLPEDEAKAGEAKVQDLTDKFNRKVDEMIAVKDKDIMTI